MAGGFGSLLFDVGANTTTLTGDMARAESIVNKSVGDINVALGKVGKGANMGAISSQVNSVISDFDRLKNVIGSVAGVSIGFAGIKQVMELADEYQNVSNRIQTTVSTAAQLIDIQKQIFSIAQDTGQSLDETAKSYQRLEQAIKGAGKTQVEAQKEALALTKTLNQEIVVSGASAGEASRAILDLVHGLSGGVLHAQQLRPIMRQMPDLAHQLAEGLGLSAAQFEEMVHKGLSAEDALKALAHQAYDIETRFNALPKTFARAWTELHNAVEQYVGQAAQAGVLSNLIKDAIVGIGNHIGVVAEGLSAVAIATGVWLGGRTLTSLVNMAVTLKQMALAQGDYRTATILSAQATQEAAAANLASLGATIAEIDAKNDLRVAERAGLVEKQAAVSKEVALLEQEAVSSTNVLAATERLVAARAELTAITTRLVVVESEMTAAQARATIVEGAETVATAELAAAKVGLATATAEAASVTGIFARGAGALFSAIGGWPTLVLAAAAGIYVLATAETEAETEAKKLDKIITQLAASHGLITPQMKGAGEAALEEAKNIAELTQRKADEYKAEAETEAAVDASSDAYVWAATQAEKYAQKAVELRVKVAELAKALLFTNVIAGSSGTALANWEEGIRGALQQVEALGPGLEKDREGFEKMAATMGQGHAAAVIWERDKKIQAIATDIDIHQRNILIGALEAQYGPTIKAAQAADAAAEAQKRHTQGLRDNKKAINDQKTALEVWDDDLVKIADRQEQLESGLRGPYLTALKQYQDGIKAVHKDMEDAIAAHKDTEEVVAQLTGQEKLLKEQYDRTTKEIKEQHDVMTQSAQDLQNLVIVLGTIPSHQDAVSAGLTKYQELQKSHYDFLGNYIPSEEALTTALDDQLPKYVALQQAIHDVTEAQRLSEERTKMWTGIWTSAADAFTSTFVKALVEGEDLLQGLADLAKQIVEQIITYFLKLAVINPILNQIFGNTAGWQQLAQVGGGGGQGFFSSALQFASAAAGSGGGANSGWTIGEIAAAAGGGGTGTQGTGTGGGSYLSSGASLFQAGRSLWTGFSSAFDSSSAASSNWFGTYTPDYGAGTYAPSALGYGAAAAGGIYAGYNRYQQSNGGAAGIAGAAAYGYGTYAATIGVGAALSGGVAAGVAAIPVVGWIAIAAMLIDKFSGGKLFGTKGNVQSGTTNLSIGAGGAQYTNVLALKGQKPLFGGADWSTEVQAQTPEQAEAAKKFFEQMTKSMKQYADMFGTEASALLDASFGQVFDKNGKLTGQTLATIAGHEYKDVTAEQFSAGYLAANELEVLQTFDDKLKGTIEVYRDSIDDLVSIAAGLTNAQVMFQAGGKFLAIEGDQTLSAVVELASGLQMAGEAIGDTINRLIQAQAAYDQFVGQFKVKTYVDDFEKAMAGIGDQMAENIKQANALAKAAGAAGASEEDLANIHAYAAAQAAQALQALEASAQSLAFSMGLTVVGSLDEVNAEIQRLQGKANQGAGALHGLGDAASSMAQKANDAIQRLIGDLSPLNDQQKLQVALGGLRAGTVTADQVLQIGRQLYATSQAYTDLFNTVQGLAGGGRGDGSGAHGGGAPADGTGGGLSGAERERLTQLLAEQQSLQAAQDYQNARTLAQQIAEIALAKGVDFHDVVESMGINLQDLEKRLNLNDDQFAQLISDAQDQKDSDGNNTASIVDAIMAIGTNIVNAINGGAPPSSGAPGDVGSMPSGPPTIRPGGHSGHGMSGRELGREIAAGFNAAMSARDRRSARV